jgi:hypothetical protein
MRGASNSGRDQAISLRAALSDKCGLSFFAGKLLIDQPIIVQLGEGLSPNRLYGIGANLTSITR